MDHHRTSTPDAQRNQVAGYHRVVIAIGADGGAPAIKLGRALAAPDAVFILARIHHPPHPGEQSARVDADLTGPAETLEMLRSARELLGQPCEIVADGAPTSVVGLHKIAEEESADLLVVGHHQGISGAHSALPAVLRGSPCPVAIAAEAGAPSADEGLQKIGFAFDETQPGRHAAHVAAKLARSRGAELHGMRVITVEASPWSGPVTAGWHTLQRLEGTLAEAARESLKALAPSAVAHVVEGKPVEELTRFAGSVDLLVVGTRGAGPLCRLASGSTAESLSVRCPFALLVTAGDDDPS